MGTLYREMLKVTGLTVPAEEGMNGCQPVFCDTAGDKSMKGLTLKSV